MSVVAAPLSYLWPWLRCEEIDDLPIAGVQRIIRPSALLTSLRTGMTAMPRFAISIEWFYNVAPHRGQEVVTGVNLICIEVILTPAKRRKPFRCAPRTHPSPETFARNSNIHHNALRRENTSTLELSNGVANLTRSGPSTMEKNAAGVSDSVIDKQSSVVETRQGNNAREVQYLTGLRFYLFLSA